MTEMEPWNLLQISRCSRKGRGLGRITWPGLTWVQHNTSPIFVTDLLRKELFLHVVQWTTAIANSYMSLIIIIITIYIYFKKRPSGKVAKMINLGTHRVANGIHGDVVHFQVDHVKLGRVPVDKISLFQVPSASR